ncbi:MAG: beta-phosphoglucomutase [Candidatus Melainabacteria bacterium GWF2_37_15]|nr:MAG: beta-phosphoglucomutase [Candidatus Melainabacteria bacterium GWF2_37_15]
MLENVKAFIFDLDGVITDTSVLHEKAWRKMAQEDGIPFPENLSNSLRGVSRRKSLELILENTDRKYTEIEIQEMMDRKNRYYRESLAELSPNNLLPGAEELIDTLNINGYKVAIGSSSKNAAVVIEKLGIKHKLDAVVDGTEIEKSKPDPEIFLKAAEKLALPPNECAVVEDAASGVEAANAGGFVSIGIGPESRFIQENQKPNMRLNNVQELLKNLIN